MSTCKHRPQSPEGWSLPSKVARSQARLVLWAIGRRTSVPCHVDLSGGLIDSLENMVALNTQKEKSERGREREATILFVI